MIRYKDCPHCGVNQIRDTVSLCDSCEIAERYEEKISSLEEEIVNLRKENDNLKMLLDKTNI